MTVPRMIFFWLGLFVPPSSIAADVNPADAAVRALGREWLASNDGVGLSIGVYVDGQRRFYNFGSTQLDGNKTPTKDTIYEISSIAKTMTGQLLARAVIEGRASLEDDVAKYLDEPYPNLENGGERVRLRHLANLTSQLADNIPDLTQVRMVVGEPLPVTLMRVVDKYSRAEFLKQAHRIVPRRPPGSEPSHSNVASMLLGVALEKIYGEPFDVILTREIEKPLKMGSGTAPVTKLLARGYTRTNEELPAFGTPLLYPSGSLRYSTDDLLRYASWQLVERDASVKLAHQPTWTTPDQRLSVALYWIGEQSPQGRRLSFTGASYGFSSACELYPDARVAVVLLSNKAADGAQESLRALSAKIVALLSPQPSSTGVPQPDR